MCPTPDTFSIQTTCAAYTELVSVLYGLIFCSYWRDLGAPGGWVVLLRPEIRLEGETQIPDLAGWRVGRYARPGRGAFQVAPNWTCDVLPLKYTTSTWLAKESVYSRWGVQHAWTIEPAGRNLSVLRQCQGSWVLSVSVSGLGMLRAEPFEALELDLSLLWGEEPGGPAPSEGE